MKFCVYGKKYAMRDWNSIIEWYEKLRFMRINFISVFVCICMNEMSENLCSYAFLYEKMVLSCSMSMKSNDDEMNICK